MARLSLKQTAQTLLRGSSWFVAVFQAALIFVSLVLAWLLRFDFSLPYRRLLFAAAPILILIRLAAVARFRLLHGWWRYTGVSDAVDIAKAVTLGSVAFYLTMRFVLGIIGFPRSIYILEALLTAGFLAGVRLLSRILVESARQDFASSKKVVLIGGGFAAQMILRDIERPGSGYHAVACVDDDRTKVGIKIQGVPVRGTVDELPRILTKHPADEILIAVPSATNSEMQRFVSVCQKAGIKFRTVPALHDLIGEQVTVKQLRDVNVEDLLGREPVQIDLAAVERRVRERIILVTGAAGSIGSELCRQIARFHPAGIVGFDIAESPLFEIDSEMRRTFADTPFWPEIGNIQNRSRLDEVLRHYSPSAIYHAAAYKHVPMMEAQVFEAVENNVFGTCNVVAAAAERGVEDFVLISSDKAVRPTSIMGATKRVAELVLLGLPNGRPKCVAVRFGNVLGSNGSVIPIFKKQIGAGGPVTVTHPEMRRFFMTISEACQLVLHAGVIAEGGQICVLEMGQPVKIVDLARNLILLSGLKPDEDIRIEFTGVRPGEKLYEELSTLLEDTVATAHEKIRIYTGNGLRNGDILNWLDCLRENCERRDLGRLVVTLKEMVPDYSPSVHLLRGLVEAPPQKTAAMAV